MGLLIGICLVLVSTSCLCLWWEVRTLRKLLCVFAERLDALEANHEEVT